MCVMVHGCRRVLAALTPGAGESVLLADDCAMLPQGGLRPSEYQIDLDAEEETGKGDRGDSGCDS